MQAEYFDSLDLSKRHAVAQQWVCISCHVIEKADQFISKAFSDSFSGVRFARAKDHAGWVRMLYRTVVLEF